VKIAFGIKLREEAWGGGNQALKALRTFLIEQGHDVFEDLQEPDLDILMLTDPRRESQSATFQTGEIFHYIRKINPRAVVVHRVNECDERKNTSNVNASLRRGNLCADATVFVSAWLEELHRQQGMRAPRSTVIHNGSDASVFHSDGFHGWQPGTPIKLVTHHWGTHPNKGFEIYEAIDRACGDPDKSPEIEFTYIGRKPEGLEFPNSRTIPSLTGHQLADELRRHHVYITASRFEPGSNHQNEGALCGLPVLYREDSSMDEYCRNYGVSFAERDWEGGLIELIAEYEHFRTRMPEYPFTAEKMAAQYLQLFQELLDERRRVLGQRPKLNYWKWKVTGWMG